MVDKVRCYDIKDEVLLSLGKEANKLYQKGLDDEGTNIGNIMKKRIRNITKRNFGGLLRHGILDRKCELTKKTKIPFDKPITVIEE